MNQINPFPKKINLTSFHPVSSQGFTLIEVLVITIILGVLAAAAAPIMSGFRERQQLNTAQGELYRGIQQAQKKARQQKTSWQVSFREEVINGERVVQWRSENEIDADPDPFLNNVTGGWNNLDPVIALDTANTTIEDNNSIPKAWRIQFDYEGRAMGDNGIYNGKVTLSGENIDDKRCVIVSTILGTIRQAKDDDCL